MKQHRLYHNRKKCMGCGSCVLIAENIFALDNEGCAFLKEGKKIDKDMFSAEILDCDLPACKTASQACPLNAIRLDEKE